MSLSRFSIIVAVDAEGGIAKAGSMPWKSSTDMRFFRETTVGVGRNAVVMGRKTYDSIPQEHRPLADRKCIIISKVWKQENYPDILVFDSLISALAGLSNSASAYDSVFVIGGESIYKYAMENLLYLCDRIIVTRFKAPYGCDQFFPTGMLKSLPQICEPVNVLEYNRHFYKVSQTHGEYAYLDLLKRVLQSGVPRVDRTGVGTISLFGVTMEFDISERIPLFTTKRMNYDIVLRELLFFVCGDTDTKRLEEFGVSIWKDNTSRDFLTKRGLKWVEGDMGPTYGFQWRHCGAEYTGAGDYVGKGIDQLANVIQSIKDDPFSRRHIVSAWNVEALNQMPLPPCHILFQFYVSSDKKWLDCCLYQRSADMALGVPFNVASYSTLTYMVAHATGLKPRKFIHMIGDVHIYNNHVEGVKRQLTRTPRPFPKLSFTNSHRIESIDDFKFDSFVLSDYDPCPHITYKMAV